MMCNLISLQHVNSRKLSFDALPTCAWAGLLMCLAPLCLPLSLSLSISVCDCVCVCILKSLPTK